MALFLLVVNGFLGGTGVLIITDGRHIDAIRQAPGARSTQLTVDRIMQSCSESCSFTSIGHLTDDKGVTRRDVSVVPGYSRRNSGPIPVVYSVRYPTQAVQVGNNGDGDYWVGSITIGAVILLDALVLTVIVVRLRRRRRSNEIPARHPLS